LEAHLLDTGGREALESSLLRLPDRTAKWRLLETRAQNRHEQLVSEMNILDAQRQDLEAKIFRQFQERLSAPGEAALTTAAIKPRYLLDERVVDLQKTRSAIAEEVRLVYEVLEALAVTRKGLAQADDALRKLSSVWREEVRAGRVVPPKRDVYLAA